MKTAHVAVLFVLCSVIAMCQAQTVSSEDAAKAVVLLDKATNGDNEHLNEIYGSHIDVVKYLNGKKGLDSLTLVLIKVELCQHPFATVLLHERSGRVVPMVVFPFRQREQAELRFAELISKVPISGSQV